MRIRIRQLILLIIIFAGIFMLATKQNHETQGQIGKTKIIYISQVIEHPALNSTTQGIKDILSKNGFSVHVESAQASPALASQIASKFMAQNLTVVVGVGTVSAQSFVKYALQNKVKLVFSSVTDPKGAFPESPNIGGVSNFVPLEPQLELFKKLQPGLNRLGILYNAGEANSISIVKKLKTIFPTYGLTLVEQTINKTADVAQSVVQLAERSDAIFISNDNTALSAMKTITKLSKVPVYVSDIDAVSLGAVAALGPDQYEVGQQTGEMILRVLKGDKPTIELPNKTKKVIRQ
jgi:putative ABC transport system substrate-binding protein